MMRLLKYGISTIALLAVSLCLMLVAINWNDEPLRPEVQAALEWKVPEHAFEDNGYLIMLGMGAPAGQDAGAVGKQLLESELARYQAYLQTHTGEMPTASDYSLSKKLAATKIFCDTQKSKDCFEFYLAQDAHKQAAALKEYRFLTDRLRAIRQSKNYVEVWSPYPYHNIPFYGDMLNAAKLEHIQAIAEISKGNIQKGLARFVENAQFSRRLLRESNTLISHMIALAMIKADMRILSELLAKYPALARYREQLAPVVTPIATSEYSLSKAFQGERQIFLPRLHADLLDIHTTLRENREQKGNDTLSEASGLIADRMASLGLLRNATVNLSYDLWELRLKLAIADANHLDEALASTEQEKDRLLGWGYAKFLYPKNPVGKILQLIAEPAYKDYIFKHHDTDGYVRLVALQLKLIAEHVPAARIPEALANAAQESRDPYTLQPMQWDAASSELRFQGRQDSSNGPNKKFLYTATLPR